MPLSVPISYGDLFEFLQDYRQQFGSLSYSAPSTEPAHIGDDATLLVEVPVMDERIQLRAQVTAASNGQVELRLFEDDDGLGQLEGFYRFVGQIVEQMLVSGRFKVVGQWEDGAAPMVVGGAAAPGQVAAASASEYTDPATLGPAASSGKNTLEELTELLMRLYQDGSNGVIEFKSEDGRRLAYVKKGGIVQFINDPVVEEECLGALLNRAGRIDKEQLNRSLQMMNDTGDKQGQCLIEMGVLTFPQLVMSLMTQAEIIARNVMSSGEGTWGWWPLNALPNSIVTPPMKTPGFLFGFYKRHFATVTRDELERRTGEVMDKYCVLSSSVNWGDMRLKKVESRFMDILGGRSWRFREVFTVSNLGRGTTEQILLALLDMGMLEIVEEEDRGQIEARWRDQLERKLLFMRDQNPFEVLEAHWTSRTAQVTASYERMKAEYKNFAKGAKLPDDVDKTRLAVLDNIEQAFQALKTVEVRQETRKKHYEPMQHDFSADLLFRQGEMLMVRARWEDALENFERAIELMPNEGKYRKFREMARKQQGGRLTE